MIYGEVTMRTSSGEIVTVFASDVETFKNGWGWTVV